jgi:hypothetical protein
VASGTPDSVDAVSVALPSVAVVLSLPVELALPVVLERVVLALPPPHAVVHRVSALAPVMAVARSQLVFRIRSSPRVRAPGRPYNAPARGG